METQFSNNLLQYFLSPAMTVAFMWFVLEKVYKLGEISQQFKTFQKDIHELKEDMKDVRKELRIMTKHINIIKTFLVSKHHMDARLFNDNS